MHICLTSAGHHTRRFELLRQQRRHGASYVARDDFKYQEAPVRYAAQMDVTSMTAETLQQIAARLLLCTSYSAPEVQCYLLRQFFAHCQDAISQFSLIYPVPFVYKRCTSRYHTRCFSSIWSAFGVQILLLYISRRPYYLSTIDSSIPFDNVLLSSVKLRLFPLGMVMAMVIGGEKVCEGELSPKHRSADSPKQSMLTYTHHYPQRTHIEAPVVVD